MGRTVAFVMVRDNVVVEALVHSTVEEVSMGGSIAGTLGNRGGTLEAHVAFDTGNIQNVVAVVVGPLWVIGIVAIPGSSGYGWGDCNRSFS